MSAKVQISKDFLDGVKILLEELQGHSLDEPTRILCKSLENELEAKYAAIERRKVFTQYKEAPTGSPEREKNRQAYLDQSEIHKDWRSRKEVSHSQ